MGVGVYDNPDWSNSNMKNLFNIFVICIVSSSPAMAEENLVLAMNTNPAVESIGGPETEPDCE